MLLHGCWPLEDKRMASGIIGNDVPRKGLRVRVPCPPLGFSRPVLSSDRLAFARGGSPRSDIVYACNSKPASSQVAKLASDLSFKFHGYSFVGGFFAFTVICWRDELLLHR